MSDTADAAPPQPPQPREPMTGADDGTLRGKLDRIATNFADAIIQRQAIDKQEVEIFRALVQYAGAARKIMPRAEDETPVEEGDEDGFRASITRAAAVPNGRDRGRD